MNLNQVLKKYQKYTWIEEEAWGSLYIMGEWCTCYLQGNQIFGRQLYSVCFFEHQNDYMYEWSSIEESQKNLAWLLKKYHDDKKYWQKKNLEYKKIVKEIDDIFYYFRDQDISKFSNKKLAEWLKSIFEIGSSQFGYNLIAEAFDVVDQAYYQKFSPEAIRVLSTPETLSFLEREHLDLLKLARQKKSKNFSKLLIQHQHDYFWIQNNYKQAQVIKSKYFLDNINNILKNKKLNQINQEIDYLKNKKAKLTARRSKIKISRADADFFALLRLLAAWQDRRKENIQKLVFAAETIFDQIVKRSKVPKHILRKYFVDDLVRLLLTSQKLTKQDFIKRSHILFYSYLDKSGRIKKHFFMGAQAGKAKAYFRRHLKAVGHKTVQGFVASHGKDQSRVEGQARIVIDPSKDKFNKGEILVTGMTRPEYAPLMKRARAVITNEGGITSHAAIISRELKIPCIIGTKTATTTFKNGDIIIMDLNTGLCRKKTK